MIFLPAVWNEDAVRYFDRCAYLSRVNFPSEHNSVANVARRSYGSLVPGLAQLASECRGALGDAREILFAHTHMLADMKLLMSSVERDRFIEEVCNGKSRCRVMRYRGLGTGFLRSQNGRAYCQKCAEEDINTYHFSYWHVEHTFPAIQACSKHLCSLTYGCLKCALSQPMSRAVRLPRQDCYCGRAAVPILEDGSKLLSGHVRVARILADTLSIRTPFLNDRCDIPLLLRCKARDLGFARGIGLDRDALRIALCERFGEEFFLRLGLLDPSRSPIFIERLSSLDRQPEVLCFAVLVDFLFGGLVQLLSAGQTFDQTRDSCRMVRKEEPRGMKYSMTRLRLAEEKLAAFLESRPFASRTEVLAHHRYSAEYLKRHDRAKYDKVMPVSRRNVGYRESRLTRMIRLDDVLVEHVSRRHRLLRSEPRQNWRRLTERSLLLGHPVVGRFYSLRAELPKTLKLIGSLLDTDQYQGEEPS